jgi:beta-phosphoglucomutase-like phosphatase (HAD superfamily)
LLTVGTIVFDLDGVLIDSEPVWNRFTPAGGRAARNAFTTASSIWRPPTDRQRLPRPLAGVVDLQ